jgi:hypothetical protein
MGMRRLRRLNELIVLACILVAAGAVLAEQKDDPLSGTWVGDWGPSASDRNQVTVELKWDGKTLTGTVNPGPNAVAIEKASFDPKTKKVHFEAKATSRRGQERHYVVDGTLEKNTLSGSWNHETRSGDFKITKK